MVYFDLNRENKCKNTTLHLYKISPEIIDNFCLEYFRIHGLTGGMQKSLEIGTTKCNVYGQSTPDRKKPCHELANQLAVHIYARQ